MRSLVLRNLNPSKVLEIKKSSNDLGDLIPEGSKECLFQLGLLFGRIKTHKGDTAKSIKTIVGSTIEKDVVFSGEYIEPQITKNISINYDKNGFSLSLTTGGGNSGFASLVGSMLNAINSLSSK